MQYWLAAFLSGIAVDVLATMVFHYTSKNRAFMAANVNVMLVACSLFIFVDISKHQMLAIPYLVGIWIGGLIGVRLKMYLENK